MNEGLYQKFNFYKYLGQNQNIINKWKFENDVLIPLLISISKKKL